MERIEIKRQAKQLVAVNRRFLTQLFVLYFCILLFSVLVTYIGHYNKILFYLSPAWLVGMASTLYSRTIIKILSALLSAPILLIFYKATYIQLNHKEQKTNLHTAILWLKDREFLLKSLALGIIICLFTVTFDFIGNFISTNTKTFQWPWYKLIPLLTSVISIILSFLIDLLYCVAGLFPKKSAGWVLAASIKVVVKNFFDYFVFVLSFLLWFLIELAGMVILYFLAKNLEGSYTLLALDLVFVSPLMMGVGVYFWPYYNAAKAIICKDLAKRTIVS
jgi:Protein of unknown function (DUF975).